MFHLNLRKLPSQYGEVSVRLPEKGQINLAVEKWEKSLGSGPKKLA